MNHEPHNYICPFCDWLTGNETEWKQNSDIVLQDAIVTAFISPKWWANNAGHVIVIPNHHVENIYTIDDQTLAHIATLTKKISIAIRNTYPGCTGISTRQHNEASGNQSIWHFHTHIFPRYADDNLYETHSQNQFAKPAERAAYAERLQSYFTRNK